MERLNETNCSPPHQNYGTPFCVGFAGYTSYWFNWKLLPKYLLKFKSNTAIISTKIPQRIIRFMTTLGRGMTWRNDDERVGFFQCNDDYIMTPYLDRSLDKLKEKMMDTLNNRSANATASLKIQGLTMQVSLWNYLFFNQ